MFGVNRAANTLYLYWHTFHFVEEFIKVRYKVSDIPFKALDESFVEASSCIFASTESFRQEPP